MALSVATEWQRFEYSISNPNCRVVAIKGALPQSDVLDEVVWADVILGCVDQHHARVALSDISMRYLIPAIDCAVGMEGIDGQVSGQIVQLVRMYPEDPCVYCRRIVDQKVVEQELICPDERQQRQDAARRAQELGGRADHYWRDLPQINTVGYLTTATGSIAAGFALGLITARFEPPFTRMQMNLSREYFDTTNSDFGRREQCSCDRFAGTANQGARDALIHPPIHWPTCEILEYRCHLRWRCRLNQK